MQLTCLTFLSYFTTFTNYFENVDLLKVVPLSTKFSFIYQDVQEETFLFSRKGRVVYIPGILSYI